MSEFRIRRRTRLKQKDARALRERIAAAVGGAVLWPEDAPMETGEAPDMGVVLVQNEPVAIEVEGDTFLSVRGLLRYRPEDRFVTVDMGAVKFVTNGADIMAPGIVDADPALREGDLCWIRDERNKQPLAVGRCEVDAPVMVREKKGKAVKSVHYIGDKLWEWEG